MMLPHELIVDLFAGGGGASEGIFRALGRHPDIAVNHDEAAIAMHEANHPTTRHYSASVFDVDPVEACGGRAVGLLWLSPDCRHFSRAKGAKPVSKSVRSLAWVGTTWAEKVRPRVIILENVPEFQTWGPLLEDGRPDPARQGETFAEYVDKYRSLGYSVAWRELVAADYGAPTTRRRLFLVARCDGEAITWPEPTHTDPRRSGDLWTSGTPTWRTAAECIDWTVPCPSIFGRKKPLADSTCRRIAEGIRRYVIGSADPFVIAIDNKSAGAGASRSIRKPLPTITTENRHALVAAFIAKHYTGVIGHDPRRALGTITAQDHHSVVDALLDRGEDHAEQVRAFLIKYYGTGRGQDLTDPLGTVTTKDRFGLVMVRGELYRIVDIGLRMLTPRELATAQGFPASYVLTGTVSSQVARIGNSVCPPVAAAVVAAQFGDRPAQEVAA